MASIINTNMPSLNAQRNLSNTQAAQAKAIRNLSSGLRVNGAADDAAGLAIAERMNAQAKGMSVAIRNSNDGISLAQTADSALGQVGSMLQRMRELAVQSANYTNDGSDRSSLQKEVDQLSSQINDVLNKTKFGQKTIFNNAAGSANATASFQVGSNGTDTLSFNQTDLTVASFKTSTTGADGVTLTSTSTGSVNLAALGEGATITHADGSKLTISANTDDKTSATSPFVAKDSSGKVVSDSDGKPVDFSNYVPKSGDTITSADGTSATTYTATGLGTVTGTTGSTGKSLDVSSLDAANDSVAVLDAAIDVVNDERAAWGARQNRFESIISNLNTGVENTTASRSRIVDADFAQETASLSRAQVLQQAGTAMLAQANQIPQGVLSLLR